MRVPQESLDDFVAAAPKPAEPPPIKFVRPSGYFEELKPLARAEVVVKKKSSKTAAFVPPAAFPGPQQEVSWFFRSLAVAGGFILLITFIFGSSILIGIDDPPIDVAEIDHPDVIDRQPESLPRIPKGPSPFDSFPAKVSPVITGEPLAAYAAIRALHVRRRAAVAVYRPVRRPASRRPLTVTAFVPTTLVIYPENGVIKTRIEPQLTAIYKDK
jgi:hypothetical protein